MFKFNKPVDQEQELEEGQISDGGIEQPHSAPAPRVYKKPPTISHIHQQSDSAQEYVIEKVQLQSPTPQPERGKKQRKELKAEDKKHERAHRVSRSPESMGYTAPPLVPQLAPSNPYYSYTPQPIFKYGPVPEPQFQPLPQAYPHVYPPRQPQWHPNQTVSPNKVRTDYPQRQPYAYGAPMPYRQQVAYSNVPQYQISGPVHGQVYYGGKQYQGPAQGANPQDYARVYQDRDKKRHQERQQDRYLDKQQERQQERQQRQHQEQNRAKEKQREQERSMKLEEKTKLIRDSIGENDKTGIADILRTLRDILQHKKQQKIQSIQNLHIKIQQHNARDQTYHILSTLQCQQLLQKLKQKQIQSRLIDAQKKKQAELIYNKLKIKDPRVRAIS